jgi:hypothetical protein
MNDQDSAGRHDAPEALLSEAMGVGRELAAILRAEMGLFAHQDRVLIDMVARGIAGRRVLDARLRGLLSGLVDKLDRRLAAATTERVEYEIVRVDEHGENLGARVVRVVAEEARPLIRARRLAVRLADLVDRVNDIMEADRVIMAAMAERAVR